MSLDLAQRAHDAVDWTILPAEAAGLRLSWIYVTPNGRFWVHSSSRLLTDLYSVVGVS